MFPYFIADKIFQPKKNIKYQKNTFVPLRLTNNINYLSYFLCLLNDAIK